MNKEVLRLALPSILANITVPLVGIVDVVIAGHIADASVIGGIAIGTMLFDLLYWNFGFLRVGTGGMTAQAYGRGDKDAQFGILIHGLKVVGIVTAAIWLLQLFFVDIVLAIVPCSATVEDFARRYFAIRIWAAPATLSLMVFKGWFIGMQNTVFPMTCDIVVNVTNILGSYLLAVHTPLGAIGVAYGTLIAQYTGLIVATALYTKGFKKTLHPLISRSVLHIKGVIKKSEFFKLNSTLFIRSVCMLVVYVGFTSLTSYYGDNPLAIGSIMMKLFMVLSYFIDGFAYAGEALTGRFIGAKNESLLTESIKSITKWTLGIGVAFTIIFLLWGKGMIGLITSDENIINGSIPFLPWLVAMPLIGSIAFMWDGIFIGATAGKEIMLSMVFAAIGFFASYVLLFSAIGVHAVYAGYITHLVIRAIYLTLRWKKEKKRSFLVV